MSLSLRDQLIAAGLAPKKAAKEGNRPARAPKAPRNQPPPLPAATLAAQRAQAEKFVRDQELNRKQQEKAQRKARLAQVRQLIEQHALPRVNGDDHYNFVDDGRIRRIAVTPALRAQLLGGTVLIVRCSGLYDLVPAEAAGRIRERDPGAVLAPPVGAGAAPAADDPYKDFVVPDDLTW
jgi:uncharacterized protein